MRDDWEEVTLGDICFTTSGGTPSRGNKSFYKGNIPWVKSGELNGSLITETSEYISEEALAKSSAKLFPKGTILFALYGATIGKMAVLGINASTNQAVCGIYENNKIIYSKYLYNYLSYKKGNLIQQGIGGAQPNISQTILKKLEIPIPPLPIQRAIVSKTEELFSSLDSGIADLKKAQELLKVYRQAVLKKAFEGELTKVWRKKNSISGDWEWSSFKEKGNWKGGGTPSKGKSEFWDNGDILWVSAKDMKTGVINDSQNKITAEGLAGSSAKWIKKGAVLFVVRSGILRRILPIAIAGKNLTVNQDLQAFEPDSSLSSEFVYYYCLSQENFLRQKLAKDGTTVESINVPALKAFDLPVPKREEQEEIVKIIETHLSVCAKIILDIDQYLLQSESLRQSILKKAFEGKLLSEAEIEKCNQEHDYEPASVLLERIKAEKKQ